MGDDPGNKPLVIDVDSTICETYGSCKHGALRPGYTSLKGYRALIASIGASGEILFTCRRKGRAFTGRGAARFVSEAISGVRYAGAQGPVTVRADAGFYSNNFVSACRRSGADFSVTARDQWGSISGFARLLRERDWISIPDYEGADVAETSCVPFYQQGNRERVRRIPQDLGPLLERG